jgi:hypothetical protein
MYSDGYKHTCSKIVIGVSILMGVVGLACVIIGATNQNMVPMSD